MMNYLIPLPLLVFFFFVANTITSFSQTWEADELGDCIQCVYPDELEPTTRAEWEAWVAWVDDVNSAYESMYENMFGDAPWREYDIFFENEYPKNITEIPFYGLCNKDSDNDIICPTLKTLTIAGPNRSRKTVGIGEEVFVFIKDICGHTEVTWEIKGAGGKIVDQNGPICLVQSNYKEASFRIEAELNFHNPVLQSSCGHPNQNYDDRLSEEFQVVTPTGIEFVRELQLPCAGQTGISYSHKKNRPSAGFYAYAYVKPDYVNFYNVMFKEGFAEAEPEGKYFDVYPGINVPDHLEQEAIMPDIYVPSLGSRLKEYDQIYAHLACNNILFADYNATITWNIPVKYKDEDAGAFFEFTKTPQVGTNKSNVASQLNPLFIMEKKGVNEVKASAKLNWDNTPCQIILGEFCP